MWPFFQLNVKSPPVGGLLIFQRCSDLAPFPGQATSYPPGSPGSGPTAIYLGGPNPQTQPLSNSGTVLLDTQWAYAHYGRSLSEAVELLRMWSENLYTARGDQPLSWSRRSIYNWPLCSGSFGSQPLSWRRSSIQLVYIHAQGSEAESVLKFAQGTKAESV